MLSSFDESMLRRALRIAMNGRGRVEPNPMVGCVLTKNDQIIAEGHHTHFGGPHAEPTALADCQTRGNDPRGATAYVTLEPCCHTNKKTPPCAPRLIEAGIRRVVIGCLDPNTDVDGKGVAMLRDAGLDVDIADGPVAAECQQLISPFASWGPYVTIKWAQSSNGRVAGKNGKPVRITSHAAILAVHRLRTRCFGIAVGVNTVITDDPQLTVRHVPIVRQPVRIVFDRNLRTPPHARLFDRVEDGGSVIIMSDPDAQRRHPSRFAALKAVFADLFYELQSNDATLHESLSIAGPLKDGHHLLVEAGPTLARSMLPWAHRLWVFTSSERLPTGPDVPQAAAIPSSYVETGRLTLGPDTLVEYLNRDAATFATATPSADFVLESELAGK